MAIVDLVLSPAPHARKRLDPGIAQIDRDGFGADMRLDFFADETAGYRVDVTEQIDRAGRSNARVQDAQGLQAFFR